MNGIMSKLDELRNMSGGQPQPAPAAPPMPGPAPMMASMEESRAPELMQDQAPEMVQQEQVVDAGQDAQMLADAVIKRSQGNPETALQIIEGAKGVIMNAIKGSEAQNMNLGGPMPMYADGGDIMKYGDGGEMSMNDLNPGLKALAKKDKDVVEKITGKTVTGMAGGGELITALNRLNFLRGS